MRSHHFTLDLELIFIFANDFDTRFSIKIPGQDSQEARNHHHLILEVPQNGHLKLQA